MSENIKNSKKRGRPYSITKEKEEELIRLLADGMSQTKACAYVGIAEMTIIRHKGKFSDFSERLAKAKMETTKLAHKSVKIGMLKDWKAGAWWLSKEEPERFGDKLEVKLKKEIWIEDDL